MDYKAYLDEIVNELMNDPDWTLPSELRGFLKADLEWTLLGI